MKQFGKILQYDGYVGYIIDDKGIKYIFTAKDLKESSVIEGDIVSFIVEVFETPDIKQPVARYVNKYYIDNKGSTDL